MKSISKITFCEVVAIDGQTLSHSYDSYYERVEELFKEAVLSRYKGFTYSNYRYREERHGRQEIRYYSVLSNIK